MGTPGRVDGDRRGRTQTRRHLRGDEVATSAVPMEGAEQDDRVRGQPRDLLQHFGERGRRQIPDVQPVGVWRQLLPRIREPDLIAGGRAEYDGEPARLRLETKSKVSRAGPVE
jgi:hypothetical protein